MAAQSSGGRVDPPIRLAFTLRMLSGPSYHDMVMSFRILPSTAYEIFHSTIDAILSNLHLPAVPLENADFLHGLASGLSSSRTPPSPLWDALGFRWPGGQGGKNISKRGATGFLLPKRTLLYTGSGNFRLLVQMFVYIRVFTGSTRDSLAFAVSALGRQYCLAIVMRLLINIDK